MSDIPKLSVERAVEDFLTDRKGMVSESTWRNYRYPLKQFIEFCENEGVQYTEQITPYHIKQFKLERKSEEIAYATLRNNLSALRVFIRWCEQGGIVEGGLADKIDVPPKNHPKMVSDTVIEEDEMKAVLDFLRKFEYATRLHAITQLIWHTGFRIGTVLALDLEDYDREQGLINVVHRPDTGTPLKNKLDGQRQVRIDDETQSVLNDYIGHKRVDILEDADDRRPLFTTYQQRVTANTYRKNLYAVTRPCIYAGECPHDKEQATCEWAVKKREASGCPSSVSPHPLRRAAITYALNQNYPKEHLAERANVGVDVLDAHYDAAKEEEKRKRRDRFFDLL
ncbi:integrase [Salinigranum rubrum]|uniref:Integrase n=1 Tax=Salinigranum rubrum TaxID=755307 RepID=A0A2I8VIB1_9EURY|nr:tyrosine-type recombinase/integrase [Salinigranum rubrum]AUV81624.1 integrase [Salinigranum rubrum]